MASQGQLRVLRNTLFHLIVLHFSLSHTLTHSYIHGVRVCLNLAGALVLVQIYVLIRAKGISY